MEGLRVLVFGKRILDQSEYESWEKEYNEALKTSGEDREEKISKTEEKLEKDLEILGVVGIEDKLQEEVGSTIHSLRKAGIKFWVLTGDKTKTAINIGYSCELLDRDHELFEIDEEDEGNLVKRLDEINEKVKNNSDKEYSVVVSGQTINLCEKEETQEKLHQLLKEANSVLGCRVSPKQKKDIVDLIAKRNPETVTMAIGDGANDVSMITAAHVGVGILGKEGNQAARASDFGLGEFKLLKRLILVYGRECYRKNSNLVLYNFYKNTLLTLPNFWLAFYNGMSGVLLYEAIMYQLYNVFFEMAPIMVYSVFDKEFSGTYLMKHPELYKPGIKDQHFNKTLFWGTILLALIQSIVITSVSVLGMENIGISDGHIAGFTTSGMLIYFALVSIANFKVLQLASKFNFLLLISVALSIALFPIIYAILNAQKWWGYYHEMGILFGRLDTYLMLIVMIVATSMLDIGLYRIYNHEDLGDITDRSKEFRRVAGKKKRPLEMKPRVSQISPEMKSDVGIKSIVVHKKK